MAKTVEFHFDHTSFRDVIEALHKVAGLNLTLDGSVQGSPTLDRPVSVDVNLPLRQALKHILQATGNPALTYRLQRNAVVVMPASNGPWDEAPDAARQREQSPTEPAGPAERKVLWALAAKPNQAFTKQALATILVAITEQTGIEIRYEGGIPPTAADQTPVSTDPKDATVWAQLADAATAAHLAWRISADEIVLCDRG
ncbi:MAG: hypothetical protein ACREJ2_11545, partial [Planctomycetota bacterium]